MKRNRYLLCTLICGLLLYFAVPRLDIMAFGGEGIFSVAWLLLALIVVAGNLTGILYSPKRARKNLEMITLKSNQKKIRTRNR